RTWRTTPARGIRSSAVARIERNTKLDRRLAVRACVQIFAANAAPASLAPTKHVRCPFHPPVMDDVPREPADNQSCQQRRAESTYGKNDERADKRESEVAS